GRWRLRAGFIANPERMPSRRQRYLARQRLERPSIHLVRDSTTGAGWLERRLGDTRFVRAVDVDFQAKPGRWQFEVDRRAIGAADVRQKEIGDDRAIRDFGDRLGVDVRLSTVGKRSRDRAASCQL